MFDQKTNKLNNKILFVNQGFELYGSDRMLLLNIRAAQIKYPEKRIVIVLPRRGTLSDYLEKEFGDITITIKRIGVIRKNDLKHLNFYVFLRIFIFFRLIPFFNSFDLVYINSIVAIDCILALRYCKVHSFIHVHELPIGLSRSIFSRLLNFSRSDLIFVSEAAQKAYINLRNKKQFIVWNGCKSYNKLENSSQNKDIINILLLGRISYRKGHHVLIKAISLLPTNYQKNLKLKIVGDVYLKQNKLKTMLTDMVVKNNLQHIIEFQSFTSNPEILYNWANVVAIPSVLPESFGLVAIEAMSVGKLVLAANIGGFNEIIEKNVNGMLFEPGNENDLAAKIIELIENPHLIQDIGNKGLEVFQDKFSEETYLNKLTEII
ncbi:MAG: glycosyltransferase family 4 protein [Bacteroidota bacterium]